MNAIVIGGSGEQKLPALVLEHTIKKHASEPVQVIHTFDLIVPTPERPEDQSRTGFSFNRFAIPWLCGYKGKAAYLECDQIVFRDVKELFDIPFDGATVLRPENQASVLLLDCDRLTWDIEKVIDGLNKRVYSYRDLMENLALEPASSVKTAIPNEWNSLERYIEGKTALLHYTAMDCQPWRKWGHPLGSLWVDALEDAVRSGSIDRETVWTEVNLKHVVPELLDKMREWFPRGK